MKLSMIGMLFGFVALFASPAFSDSEKLNVDKVGDALRDDATSQVIKKDKAARSQPTDEEKLKYYKLLQKDLKKKPSPTPIEKQ